MRRILTNGIIITLVTAVNTGCALFSTVGPLPRTDEDFKLPASELMARFPAVKGLHGDHRKLYDRTLTLSDLERLWGEHDARQNDRMSDVAKYAVFAGIGATASHNFNPVLFGASLLTPVVVAPWPMKKYIWEKGEYRITGTFARTIFNGEPRLLGWEWARRDIQGSKVTYEPWLRVKNDDGMYVTLSHTVGGTKFAEQGSTVLHAGDNTEWAVGYRMPFLDDVLCMYLSIGYRYTGFLTMVQGTNFTQIPVRGIFEFQPKNSVLRAGFGVVYTTSSALRFENSAGDYTIVTLPDSSGYVAQLEFRPMAKAGVGVRYEDLEVDLTSGRKLDVSSTGMYLSWYF